MKDFTGTSTITLEEVRERIEGTDLIPSREVLKRGSVAQFAILLREGIHTLDELRAAVRTAKRMEGLAARLGLDVEYMTQLKREIESWAPKPVPLAEFAELAGEAVAALEEMGIRNTIQLYEAAGSAELASIGGMDGQVEKLVQLAELTRIQWVNGTFARMLLEAGYDSPASLAAADAESVCRAVAEVNARGRYFNGKIGVRDMRRLVGAAGYVGGK